jgi:hypothetical protein
MVWRPFGGEKADGNDRLGDNVLSDIDEETEEYCR